jgi:hypothetical protein
MKKVPAIVMAIVVVLSCIPWVSRQRSFSLLVGVTVIALAGFMVYRFILWVSSLRTSRQSRTEQSKWQLPISRKHLWVLGIFLALIATVPHFITTLSGDYQLAVATAQQSPEFIRTLGAPVREGWFSEGKTTFAQPIRSESLIHVSGTKREGELRVKAIKENGQWKLLSLVLELEHPVERIDLLTTGNPKTIAK